jgi:hypothetical protein
MNRLHHIAGCRRVRLYVDRNNGGALHLYRKLGFRKVGVHTTGELILEALVAPLQWIAGRLKAVTSTAQPKRRERRIRLSPGPHAAFCVGVERGPPCLAWRHRPFASSGQLRLTVLRVPARVNLAMPRTSNGSWRVDEHLPQGARR